jgi:hypothetical protein
LEALGYDAPSESQIWTLDCSLGITAQWTNIDGSEFISTLIRTLPSTCTLPTAQPATSIFYDPVVNYLGLTGDLATYNNEFGDGATATVSNIVGICLPSD